MDYVGGFGKVVVVVYVWCNDGVFVKVCVVYFFVEVVYVVFLIGVNCYFVGVYKVVI